MRRKRTISDPSAIYYVLLSIDVLLEQQYNGQFAGDQQHCRIPMFISETNVKI